MDRKEFLKKIKKMNVYEITPNDTEIFADGAIEQILVGLKKIGKKYRKETFNMMPKLTNVKLKTGESVEAIAVTDFRKGKVSLIAIYLYDYTQTEYKELYNVLQSSKKQYNKHYYTIR